LVGCPFAMIVAQGPRGVKTRVIRESPDHTRAPFARVYAPLAPHVVPAFRVVCVVVPDRRAPPKYTHLYRYRQTDIWDL
jgi:hypothetical protein